MTTSPLIRRVSAAVFAVLTFSTTIAPAADLSGQSDESIRNVIALVAKHQIELKGALKDGEYGYDTVDGYKTARKPEGITWSYPWGVTLYGIIRSTDFTKDEAAKAFVLEHNRVIARQYAALNKVREKADPAAWKQLMADRPAINPARIRPLLTLGNLDACGAMGVQYIEAMLRWPDQAIPEQKAVVNAIGDYISTKQERLPDGTFWRPNSSNAAPLRFKPGTLWIDDLYMGCPYLVRWARYTGDGKWVADAAKHIINMASRLQDKDGLWFHAYFEHEQKHNGHKWGRANGWAMVATVEVLSAMDEKHPDRARLIDILKRHVDGAKAVQPPSGVWRQILNREDLWEESSVTSMFAYSIARAVNRGWLDASYLDVARKAFAGVCAGYITQTGVVKGTCEGTSIGIDYEYYAMRKRPDDDHHAPGVVLLAGSELLAAKK